ncbi:hypothetical protein ACS0TY_010527 [Phlomoides rotata]
MLDKCIADAKYHQAIRMVIECRRLDKLEEAVVWSDNVHTTINYCIDVSYSFVNKREYRVVLANLLYWLSRATNWAKFSATAGLGVIHRGHLQQGRSLMAPYLPQGGAGSGGSPYSEGGALYALGLIYANHGEGIKQFLRESLHNTNVEVIQHGVCLGLGLAAIRTADDDIFDEIKIVLYTDSAVAGEAAGISMGLLMVGTASEKAAKMLAYAHETQHEKIIRGLALGIALTVYGREEEADTLIEQMTRDQDPIL